FGQNACWAGSFVFCPSSAYSAELSLPVKEPLVSGSCAICQKRKASRFCPAKAEKICAVCCGTEREVTIDCPADCAYLIAAHRYESEHPRSLPAGTALLDETIPKDILHAHQQPMPPWHFPSQNSAPRGPRQWITTFSLHSRLSRKPTKR